MSSMFKVILITVDHVRSQHDLVVYKCDQCEGLRPLSEELFALSVQSSPVHPLSEFRGGGHYGLPSYAN